MMQAYAYLFLPRPHAPVATIAELAQELRDADSGILIQGLSDLLPGLSVQANQADLAPPPVAAEGAAAGRRRNRRLAQQDGAAVVDSGSGSAAWAGEGAGGGGQRASSTLAFTGAFVWLVVTRGCSIAP